MRLRSILLIISIFLYSNSKCQQIVDSCFLSIKRVGKFDRSNDLANLCHCSADFEAADLMEWNPTTNSWDGKLPNNPTVDLPPPPGSCLSRAIWIGSPGWTPNGEAFALRLDKPLEVGKTYSFPFTYAADGTDSEGGFAPLIYTYIDPHFNSDYAVDTLPKAQNEWVTNAAVFTATEKQKGHTWIIIHAYDKSGTVLSGCKHKNPIPTNFFPNDTTLCQQSTMQLHAPVGNLFKYTWNTGSQEDSVDVTEGGLYSATIKYYYCEVKDSINLIPTDCEVRIEMPNIITPNGDALNESLIPIRYNYIASGKLQVFNRWGNRLFEGDLFSGWNGAEVPTGVYYYKIVYEDKANKRHHANGTVTIAR